MSGRFPLRCLAALGSMAVLIASAQPVPPTPAASSAPTPRAQAGGYRSTLEGYQPFAEERLTPWGQANDTVRNIGGWRAYAKEAQDAAPAGGQAPRREPAPSAPGHGKH